MNKGIRRGLGTALAGSLLFGGLTTLCSAAASALTKGAASATTFSCAPVNASLVTGLNGPDDIAVSGSDLFVTNYATDMDGEYEQATCPTITTFTPTSGPVGTVITIKGTNLLGASSVTFNGVSGTIKKDEANKIKVKVPSGATTGRIEVTTPRGKAESATKFKVTSSSSVAFVQADDTGTINGNTTSIGSGQSNQVLAHDTGIGHSVVLMIQTLTTRQDGYRHQRLLKDGRLSLRQLVQRWCRLRDMGLHGHDRRSRHGHGYHADQRLGRLCRGVQHSRHWLHKRWWPGR